ncbi:MAG: tetratricopeptide repeat protein, partial [Lachnospiraceae bacterium]|nr:tetratricopeptide repeat protein [Lachnospiraceae bacterium]
MDIQKILEEYDAIESTHDLERIGAFLDEKLAEAQSEGDAGAMVTLLHEKIGFYRETGDFQTSITACRDLLYLMEEQGITGTLSYATSLLNVANACRAAGLLKESNLYYNEVLRIYNEELEPGDYRFAPLYNNLALLFQETGDHESACDALERARGIVSAYPEKQDKIAITHTNLALSLMKANEPEAAVGHLKEAFRIFESFPETDYHYMAALSAMGEALFQKGDLKGAAEYYERALSEIRKNTGRSKSYEITLGNLFTTLKTLRSAPGYEKKYKNGMELCRRYYEEIGAPMIREKFPEYEGRIAAGLVGEGSECYG